MIKTKITTKVLIAILGLGLVFGSVALNTSNNTNNSIKTSQAANNSYDFYSKFGTETKLTKEYFTKSLKEKNKLSKIRIDSLPLHSSLKLNNNPTTVGQEINFEEITKLTFKSSIDEYDQFNWSGYYESSYLPTVTMKVGVGSCGNEFDTVDINRSTSPNTPYIFNSPTFASSTTYTNNLCYLGIFGGIRINSLPLSGIITTGNGLPVIVGQAISIAELSTLNYTPNLNYSGTDTFEWYACDSDYFINFNYFECYSTLSNVNITIEPATGGGSITITAQSILTLSSSSSSSNISTSSTTTSEPTFTTKAFDPKKLSSGKAKPVFGVLSSADDTASVEDPYSCGGDIHGVVESSGGLDKIDVKVTIKANNSLDLLVDFDRKTGIYISKIDYNTLIPSNYYVTYKVVSKKTNKTLDEGLYKTYIKPNCDSKKEVINTNKPVKLLLARTGGY